MGKKAPGMGVLRGCMGVDVRANVMQYSVRRWCIESNECSGVIMVHRSACTATQSRGDQITW
eukprot:45493-Eustigmatos_ZCMA.PRE.1